MLCDKGFDSILHKGLTLLCWGLGAGLEEHAVLLVLAQSYDLRTVIVSFAVAVSYNFAVLLTRCKVEPFRWLSIRNYQLAARSWLSGLGFFLIFTILIGGRSNWIDFGPLWFVFAVVLSRGLRSKLDHLVFVNVDSWTVHFAPVNLRVLQSHDLPICYILCGLGCV